MVVHGVGDRLGDWVQWSTQWVMVAGGEMGGGWDGWRYGVGGGMRVEVGDGRWYGVGVGDG